MRHFSTRHMQIGRKCDECDERSLWGSDHTHATRATSNYAVVIEIYQAFRAARSYNAVTDLAKTKAETRRRHRHRNIKRDREMEREREITNLAPSARATKTPTPTLTATATFANEILLCAKSNNL